MTDTPSLRELVLEMRRNATQFPNLHGVARQDGRTWMQLLDAALAESDGRDTTSRSRTPNDATIAGEWSQTINAHLDLERERRLDRATTAIVAAIETARGVRFVPDSNILQVKKALRELLE